MTSTARQTANAANARLSTGPSTPEGKARSSQNACKHGLTAAQFVIATEDRAEFEEFLAELQAEILPPGALQQILFDELAASAESYLDLKLDRLARHKTRIERSFHRSLRELKALQTDAALTLPLASRMQIAKRTQALALGDRKNGVEDFWSGADAEAAAVLSAFENTRGSVTHSEPRP